MTGRSTADMIADCMRRQTAVLTVEDHNAMAPTRSTESTPPASPGSLPGPIDTGIEGHGTFEQYETCPACTTRYTVNVDAPHVCRSVGSVPAPSIDDGCDS